MCIRDRLSTCLATARKSGARNLEGALLVHLACAAAGRGDVEAWDRDFPPGAELVRETQFADPDVPRFAERAGDLAARRGWPTRARAAFGLAADFYAVLGRDEDAARVRDRAVSG